MPIEIIYDEQARLKFMKGINKVAKAVSVTYGSAGPAVLIQHVADGLAPVFTRDGVTIARSISCHDRVENLGARILKDVAGEVSRKAGDGTTTAIILAQAIAEQCLPRIKAGFHPVKLKQGMDMALAVLEKRLEDITIKEAGNDWIENISAIATKNEPGVGKLLAQAFNALGVTGSINFQLGNVRKDVFKIVEGIQYEQGYLSPNFITDKNRAEAVLDNPYILLYDREISDLMDLIPILEEVKIEGRPLLIIAEDVKDKALTGLLLNNARGIFNTVVVKPPGFGDKRIDRLKDIALMTGGEAILEENFTKLEHVALEQLGQARRVVVTESTVTIIGSRGDQEKINRLIGRLKYEAEIISQRKPGQGSPTENTHELEEIQERLALLNGKMGIFEVGGTTDMEIKERMVRIENAYMSCKAALEEGVIPGGGAGMYALSAELDKLIIDNIDQQQGIDSVKNALIKPLLTIASNAGLNTEEVVYKLLSGNDWRFTINTETNQYGDFLGLGIIDSAKVTRLALRSAVSIIGTLITSDVIISSSPDLSIMSGYSPDWAAETREDPRSE